MFWYVMMFTWGACFGSFLTAYLIRRDIRKLRGKG
jgi:hypothetical protein